MSTARQLLATSLMGLVGVTAMMGGDASAQQIFRIVGPDGRVTFSDQPPPQAPAGGAAPTAAARGAGGGADSAGGLPFELRQTASRYPVTLYTGPACEPCTSGRAMLVARGIPYTEKTVGTSTDIDALKRLYDTTSLPLLTVGGQQLKGFSSAEWGNYLDAAGYPKSSVLPSSYRATAPTPLVAIQAAPATPADAGSAQAQASGPAAPAAPPPAPADNPAGIRF